MARKIIKATDIKKHLGIPSVGFDASAFCAEIERIIRTFFESDGPYVHATVYPIRLLRCSDEAIQRGFISEKPEYWQDEYFSIDGCLWRRYGSVNWHVILLDEHNKDAALTILEMFDYKVVKKKASNGGEVWYVYLP